MYSVSPGVILHGPTTGSDDGAVERAVNGSRRRPKTTMVAEEPDPVPPVPREDLPSSDGEAPEEVTLAAAASAAAGALRGERVARAGIAKRTKERRRARSVAQSAAAAERARQRDAHAGAEAGEPADRFISAEALERAAAALDAKENEGKSELEKKIVTSFVDAKFNSRSVGQYRVVASGRTEKRKVGRGALRFMKRAFNAKERVPASEIVKVKSKRAKEFNVRNRF